MSRVAKHCLVWTLLLAVCVQGIAAVTSAVRGPAHVHAAASRPDGTAELPLTRAGHFDAVLALAAGYARADRFPPPVQHGAHHHDEAQRHYHLPGGDTVLVQDGSHADSGTPVEHASRGKPVSPAFIALIPEALVLAPIHAGAGFGIRPEKKLASRTFGRIERPPRPLSA